MRHIPLHVRQIALFHADVCVAVVHLVKLADFHHNDQVQVLALDVPPLSLRGRAVAHEGLRDFQSALVEAYAAGNEAGGVAHLERRKRRIEGKEVAARYSTTRLQ